MRWMMLLVLFLVRLAMGYQFQSVASTSSHLVNTFGLSYAEIGVLIGFFLLPGVFIAIPSGALTRSVTDKNLLMTGALAMVGGASVMGFATSASELYMGRLITGVGGTIFNVIVTKMVTDWFVKKEIVLALSVMLTAWPAGIALGLLTHGYVADVHGWNWVMHLTATAALVALFLTAVFYRAPQSPTVATNAPLRYGLPPLQLVHISVVGLGWTLYNAGFIAVVSFAPDALMSDGHEHGVAHSVTSLFMWTTLISLPLGGRLLESFGHVTLAIVVSLLMASTLIVGIAFGMEPVAMFVLLGIFAGIPGGALMSLSAQAVSSENRGPGLGIFFTWYYLGMTLSPAFAGWLRDSTGSVTAPVLFSALLLAGVIVCVGVLRILQARWPIHGHTSSPLRPA